MPRAAPARADPLSGHAAPPARDPPWLGPLLALSAGFVDVVVYLSLVPVFISFVSGNTVRAGIALAESDWAVLAQHLVPVVVFFLGALGGSLIGELVTRHTARRSLGTLLALEAGLLASAVVCAVTLGPRQTGSGAASPWVATILTTVAMGVQNVAFRRIGRLTIRTTFVTGLLVTLAEETARYVFWRRDRAAGRPAASDAVPAGRNLLVLVAVWVCYLTGAVAGALGTARWAALALVIPLAVLVAATSTEWSARRA